MVKILLTDDSIFMRTMLKNILSKQGFKDFVEAGDGVEAIEKFKTEKPDLVLLDIVMEKMEGIEVLKKLMQLNPNSKVVMVSAVGQEQMVKEAMSNGAKDFIVKPFQAEKVVETVKKILG